MRVGSLFSGIGGLELGLERAGMHVEWQVENDTFCQKVLAKHWPDAARYGDVRTVGKHNLSSVDLICGGFPCQPHSIAGERKASDDGRDLWPEFFRIICELKPEWVVAENVMGVLSSESGDFFGAVLRDLASQRYDVEWFCLPASSFGAPHRRERIFLVAHTISSGLEEQQSTSWTDNQSHTSSPLADSGSDGTQEYVANSSRTGREECNAASIARTEGHGARRTSAPGGERKSESRMGRDTDGIPRGMDGYWWPAGPREDQYRWEPRRVTQEKVVNRAARLKALGNAVVPQAAEYIGRYIMGYEN